MPRQKSVNVGFGILYVWLVAWLVGILGVLFGVFGVVVGVIGVFWRTRCFAWRICEVGENVWPNGQHWILPLGLQHAAGPCRTSCDKYIQNLGLGDNDSGDIHPL